MKELEVNLTMFDNIKHIDLDGNEYWSARELQKVLEYAKWENFHKVIKQAICACKNSDNKIKEHFPEVRKMLEVGKEVRNSIKRLGGTEPYDLPTPKKSLKELEKESVK